MKTTLAIFGAVTAMNTLVAYAWLWSAFKYDKPDWITMSKSFYLDVHETSYVVLLIILLLDLGYWGRTKWIKK